VELSRAEEETICEHRSAGGPTVTHVRGTLLASSLHILKDAGHYDAYLKRLPDEFHERVLYTLAMSWVPIDVAMAHYSACDALALDDAELNRIGLLVSTRYADSFLGTMLRTSRQAGLEAPWMALRAQTRIWDRVYIGGSIGIYRTGPKDGISEKRGLPLAQIRYFRGTYLGWFQGLGDLFVKKLYLRYVRPRDASPHTLAVAGSWV
jgi:hypothetical protein